MADDGQYIELCGVGPLTPKDEVPRFRAISEGSYLFHKSQSMQVVAAVSVDASTQTDYEEKYGRWHLVREKALSIGLHVALIATFETLFFFQFVSSLADKGIIDVVDRFSNILFGGCQNLTLPARFELLEVLDILGNVTGLAGAEEQAITVRHQTNQRLLLASWLFTGGLYLAWLVAASIMRRGQPWITILLENAVMIGVLAIYEAVFVNVIVLKYDSITLPEIESRMFDNAYELCI